MLSAKLFRTVALAAAVALAAPVAAQERSAATTVKDAWITTQIQAKYFGDSLVKGRNIDVDTTNGVVTLTGDVSSAAERQRAVAKAREVDGVKTVQDRLTIGRGEAADKADKLKDKADKAKDRADAKADRAKDKADAKADRAKDKADKGLDRVDNQITDAWITTKVQSKYYLDTDVKGLNIDVTTNGGVVTLTGKVGSAAERQKALALAKETDGVKQVIDKLAGGK